MKTIENPNSSTREISEIITGDSALASRVLKVANSALFARSREISTLSQAITVIGFKVLKGIVISVALNKANKGSNIQQLVWENSIATAYCCYSLARALKKPFADELFMAGLLHSLGQVVLLTVDGTKDSYHDVVDLIVEKSIPWQEAELAVYGFAHPLIGALVAKKWNFADELCHVILHAKDPYSKADLAELADLKACMVQFADLLVHKAGIGNPENYPASDERLVELGAMLEIDKVFPAAIEQSIEDLAQATRERFEAEKGVYG